MVTRSRSLRAFLGPLFFIRLGKNGFQPLLIGLRDAFSGSSESKPQKYLPPLDARGLYLLLRAFRPVPVWRTSVSQLPLPRLLPLLLGPYPLSDLSLNPATPAVSPVTQQRYFFIFP